MRFVVYGAGAVGGTVGGLLHRAGSGVILIARGPHLAALRDRGLRLVTPHLDEVLPVPAVGSPDELEWTGDEVVLVAVKSDATPVVARSLAAAAPHVTVVSLQNGVTNEAVLAESFRDVLGVTVMAPTAHLEPGVVVAKSAGVPAILDVGRWPDGTGDSAEAVAAAFRVAGFVSEPRPDIMAWKHRKLLLNLGNVVDACCVDDAAAERLTNELREEGESVLATAGIPVVPDEVDRARRGDLLRRGRLPVPAGGSTWQSLARGTGRLETDQLNGHVVRLAEQSGVAAPLNRRAVALAERVLAEGLAPRSVDAATLLG